MWRGSLKISLIASSIRCWLWDELFWSLEGNKDYEVIFSGNLSTFQVRPYLKKYPMLKYIHTADCVPPAQCYEAARRNATGELIMWVCDDAEFSDHILDNVYEFHHKQPTDVQLISIKTRENDIDTDLNLHTILGSNINTPLMAPIGVISRDYLNMMGGFDRRYVCGQYENDVSMRVYANGAKVIKYEEGCVRIDHLVKHGKGTAFWKGYDHDRHILENTWIEGGFAPLPAMIQIQKIGTPPESYFPVDNRKVSMMPLMPFEPYKDEDLTTISQCPIEWPIK